MTLQIVPFTHIQEEIRRACPEEYFTLIMRRFMTVSYTHLDVYKRQVQEAVTSAAALETIRAEIARRSAGTILREP